MRHLIFFIFIAAAIITAGCTGENKADITASTSGTTTPAPIDIHKTVDLPALQAKYEIYGSCTDVSRTSFEISQTDAIYKCSDPTKSRQSDNRNCFFNGIYIDSQVRYELASLSTEVCAREEAGRL